MHTLHALHAFVVACTQAGAVSCGQRTQIFRQLQVRRVGVAFAHGEKASDWDGHLLTELAVALAAQGEFTVDSYLSLPSHGTRKRHIVLQNCTSCVGS
jgi:hypothetical protein